MVERHHQTVRLARGRHRSPDQGACVMELASMLAGERFTDHPRCVDPVVAAYMRAVNDRLDTRERQALRPYASAAVGTRTTHKVTRTRRNRCLRYASGGATGMFSRLRLALLVGVLPAVWITEGAAEWAAREAVIRGGDAPLALLDELLADGGVPSPRAHAPLAAPASEPAAV